MSRRRSVLASVLLVLISFVLSTTGSTAIAAGLGEYTKASNSTLPGVTSLGMVLPRAVSAGDPLTVTSTMISTDGKIRAFKTRLEYRCLKDGTLGAITYSAWVSGVALGNGRLGTPVPIVNKMPTPKACSSGRYEPSAPTVSIYLNVADQSASLQIGDARSLHVFRPFTSTYYRVNLEMAVVKPLYSQAHHTLPQKYELLFKASGMNIHDPNYLRWWCSKAGVPTNHAAKSAAYNALWDTFFKTNTVRPVPASTILAYRSSIQGKFKYTC